MKKIIYFILLAVFLISSRGYATLPAFRTEGYEIIKTTQLTVEGGSSLPFLFDWDNDGKKDLIVCAISFKKIHIYFNLGSDTSPSFDKAVTLLKNGSDAYFAGTLVTGFISTNSDMNNDGNPDFLLCIDGKVNIYTSVTRTRANPSINGTPISLTFGTFPFTQAHIGQDDPLALAGPPLTSTYKNSGWPVVFDYNGDGKKDILSAYIMINNATQAQLVRIGIYTNISTNNAPVPAYGAMLTVTTNFGTPGGYYDVQTFGNAFPYAYPVKWRGTPFWDIIVSYTAPSTNVLPTGSFGFEWEYSLFKVLRGFPGPVYGAFDVPFSLTNAGNPFIPYNLGFRPTPFVGDWNNDATLDIISGEYLGNVHILQKVSDGSIALKAAAGFEGVIQQSTPCDMYPGNAAKIQILDWDNDGDWDIYGCGGNANGQQYIFINQGNNNTPVYMNGRIIQNSIGANIIRGSKNHAFTKVYDLNGDGKKDLVMGGEFLGIPPALVFCSNIGVDSAPVFSPVGIPIKADGANIALYNGVAEFGDINSDGINDIILSDLDSTVAYSLNLGTRDANGIPLYGPINYLTVGPEKETMATVGLPSVPNLLNWDKEGGARDIVAAAGSRIIYFLDTGTASMPYYEKKEEIKFDREILHAGEYANVHIIDWNADGYYDIFLCNTRDKIYRYMGLQLRYVSEDDSLMPEDGVYTYPNPAKGDTVNFKYLTRDDAFITIEIFTHGGKLVEKIEATAYFDRINTTALNCQDFANGIYIFRIKAKSYSTDQEATVVKKFAIIK
ncbi:MAG: VCBS repeat-containing protein [Spirochaetes bacterium]|nr:VCBS repeat-containing protein [Spirochaetota bacterium]